MDLVALSVCSITTGVNRTRQPSVEWNAKSTHWSTLAAVNSTTCQVHHDYNASLSHFNLLITVNCVL